MDEPSSNLDMESIRKLQKLIRMMKDEGRTVLISEHRLWYLEGIADRYVLLEDGRIRQEFTPEAAADLSLEKRKALGLRAVKQEQLYELRPDMGLIKQKSTGLEIDGLQFSRQMRQVLNVPHLEIPSGGNRSGDRRKRCREIHFQSLLGRSFEAYGYSTDRRQEDRT